jgi:hypothetical protein
MECHEYEEKANEAAWKRDWRAFEYWWDMFFVRKTVAYLAQGDWQYASMFATSVTGRHGEASKKIKCWCWAKTISFVWPERPELKAKYEIMTKEIIAWAREEVKAY